MIVTDLASQRQAPNVDKQPQVVLVCWRLFEVARAQYCLTGIVPELMVLRITSLIQAFDPALRTWTTSSGRMYETPGPPTRDSALRADMLRLACASGIPGDIHDVSDEVWTAMQRAVH